MCKTILFRIVHAQIQLELETVQTQYAKISTASFKRGKYLDMANFLVNLSDLMSKFTIFRIESIFCKPFLKRLISKYS